MCPFIPLAAFTGHMEIRAKGSVQKSKEGCPALRALTV